MRFLEADTLSNQNIATELLAGTYTADAAREVFVRVFLAQIAGAGAYESTMMVQRRGAGTVYRHVPAGGGYVFVPSGTTSACMTTEVVPMATTDVMTVYVKGLAADTTTPDIVIEFWEDETVQAGAGAVSETITINDGVLPLDGVEVWVTTDTGGSNIVASGETDTAGHVTFMLDAGSYWVWKQLSGYTFTNPQLLTVT